MNFTGYAASKGLQLLRDDIKFIKGRIQLVDKDLRKTFLRRYVELWCQGMDETVNVQLKQSIGRRMANSWLLSNT